LRLPALDRNNGGKRRLVPAELLPVWRTLMCMYCETKDNSYPAVYVINVCSLAKAYML